MRNKFGAFEEALLCEAALLFRQKDFSAAIETLEKYRKEKDSDCSLAVHFALAQMYLTDGSFVIKKIFFVFPYYFHFIL